VPGWHLDVGHDHVWPAGAGQPDQVRGVRGGADDLKIRVIQDPDDAFANE
jgi:hypothetical protein